MNLSFVTALFVASMAFSLPAVKKANSPSSINGSSVKSSSLAQDDFNNMDFKGGVDQKKWSSLGSSFAQSKDGACFLDCPKDSQGAEHIILATDQKATNITAFDFTLKIKKGSTRWLGVNFIPDGSNLASNNISNESYSFSISISSNGFGGNVLSGKNASSIAFHDRTGATATGIQDFTSQWVTFHITPKSDSEATLVLELENGNKSDAIDLKMPEHSGRSFKNTYVGFVSEQPSGGYSFKKISLKSDNINFEEDFTGETMTSHLVPYLAPNSQSGYVIRNESSLEILNPKAKEGILAQKKVEKDTSVVKSLEAIKADFSLQFSETSKENEGISFVYHLPALDADYTSQSKVLTFFKTGKITLKDYASGVASEIGTKTLSAFDADFASIHLSINKNGNMEIQKNNESASFSFPDKADYDGYLGFLSTSDYAAAASYQARIDDVKLTSSTIFIPLTKSVTHNFSNAFFGNEGHEDFVMNDGSGNLTVQDGRLAIEGVDDDAFFGSAYQYSSFVFDYKLCNIYVGDENSKEYSKPGSWIGFDLSKQYKRGNKYGSYLNLMLPVNPGKNVNEVHIGRYMDTTSPTHADDTLMKVDVDNPIPVSLLKAIQYTDKAHKKDIKEEDALCIRFISTGDSIAFYLKKASEAEYKLYYSLSNLELGGYFSLCTTGWLWAEIDDFSMANTASVYTCADNEAPEKITETEQVIIHDNSDVDVNLDKEIELNTQKGGCSGSVTTCVTLTGSLILFAFGALAMRKKHDGE